jgi:hypothetical protein
MTVGKCPKDTTRENIAETVADTPKDVSLGTPLIGRVFEVEGKTYLALNGVTAFDVVGASTLGFDEIPGSTAKVLTEVQFPQGELTTNLKTRIDRLVWAARMGIPASKMMSSVNLMVLHEPNVFDKYPDASNCADIIKGLTTGMEHIYTLQMMYKLGDMEATIALRMEAIKAIQELESSGLFNVKPKVLH